MVASHHSELVNYPPLNGSLFLPELLEFNARHNPAVTFFVYDELDSNDLVSISHLDFYQACHRAAQRIRPGRIGTDKETVALLGNFDTLLSHTMFMGAMVAGLVPFPMSPRNSVAAVIDMMKKTKCCRLITTNHSLGSLIDEIKTNFVTQDAEAGLLQIDEVPALRDLYPALIGDVPNEPFIPYPSPTLWPSNNDVLLYLHSSGSTGFPKPIPMTNITAIHWCSSPNFRGLTKFLTPIRISVASLPPFHAISMYTQLMAPIASLSSVSIYRPTSLYDPLAAPIIPNAVNILDSILRTKSNALIVVPFFLEQWASSPEAIDTLKTLQYVSFGGGLLAPKVGNALINSGVRMASMYGSTETGTITTMFRDEAKRQYWDWLQFIPDYKVRWVPQGDGTYECQLLTAPTYQLSVENLPDVKGYTTSDVFLKHPTVDGLWKIVGRIDDVLILSSGEKTVPAPMEGVISASRCVNGVLMFGMGRDHVGILIEPRAGYEIDVDDETQLAEFRNRVWPEIEEANKEAPAFSRIFKEMVIVTHRDKPMVRVAKGTVNKKATVKIYEDEINALYEMVGSSKRAGIDVPLPKIWAVEDVESWLAIHATAANSGKAVDVEVDLFAQGFDSLSATFLRNRITGSLGSSPDPAIQASSLRIDQNIIFSSPSIRRLARSVIDAVLHHNDQSTVDIKTQIRDMIDKYSVGLGRPAIDASASIVNMHNRRDHVVVLTGSTGGLGSYLLTSLIQREDVSVVYAFNRPSRGPTSSIQQRQESSFVDRGFDVTLLQSEKLVYVETDTSQDKLGLDKELYNKICTSVTVIIHNAWRLDFNLALSSFEPHVQGTRNLIDLALSSPCYPKPRFMFTSSISSAQSWDKAKGPFPEEVQYDVSVAEGLGYGASKYISERILVNSKLPASSFRIGQISGGSPRGAWSTTDWLPIIVKSSLSLGALPEAQGLISWIPSHAISNAILDVAFAEEEPCIAINLVHPRPTAWKALMQPVADAIFKHKITSAPLPLVPFSEWLIKLESNAKDTSEENMKCIPAIKLLDFMRFITASDINIRASGVVSSEALGFAPLATQVAQRVSPTMKELEPLSAVDASQWVDYWVEVGMIQ